MRPLHPDDWHPSLGHIIDAMDGRPLALHCLLANHPVLFNAWWNYRMYGVGGGDLTRRDAELVILRVAVHMRAWYEWAAHVDRGMAAGLSLAEIKRVADGPSADGWRPSEAALLLAVDELVRQHGISAATHETLSDFLSERQVLDVVSLQGMYVTIACILGTWPVAVEDFVLSRLPPEVTEAAFLELLSASHGH